MKSVLDVSVSCFRDYNTPSSPKNVNVLNWLRSDKHYFKQKEIAAIGDKIKRDQLKATLPCITPSGLFSYRSEANLIEHSGLIQFDIDWKENQHIGNYSELKTLICQSPNVAYCGLSVSGTGLWGLIPIAYPEKHSQHFDFLKVYFKKHEIIVDTKPRNVASLRGYSYDPKGYFNHKATPLTRYIEDPKKTERRKTNINDSQTTGNYDTDCFNWCVSVKDESLFVEGNRNGWLTKLVLMLNDFGVSRSFVESECVAQYTKPGFREKEILATIRSIYQNHSGKHGIERYTQQLKYEQRHDIVSVLVPKPPPTLTKQTVSEFEAEKIVSPQTPKPQSEESKYQPEPENLSVETQTQRLAFVDKHADLIASTELLGFELKNVRFREIEPISVQAINAKHEKDKSRFHLPVKQAYRLASGEIQSFY